MYQNQLHEFGKRGSFNLASYACISEGPDHSPRFQASTNFHSDIFGGPSYCATLRQADHAATAVVLNNLSSRGTSRSLAARVLDETGVYKNLLQETAHRAGLKLPVYTTVRSGPGHQPIFTCSVELAGMSFNGEPAKTKKQAEKNAAMAAWSAFKEMPNLDPLQFKDAGNGQEHEQVIVRRVISNGKSMDANKPMMQRRVASTKNAMRYYDSPLILPPFSSQGLLSSSRGTNNNLSKTSYTKGKSIVKEPLVSKSTHEFRPRPSYQRAFPPPYKRTQEANMLFSPCVYPSRMNSIGGPIPRTMSTGGFNGVAPAVLMRSVTPLFAAPPRPTKPSQNTSEIH